MDPVLSPTPPAAPVGLDQRVEEQMKLAIKRLGTSGYFDEQVEASYKRRPERVVELWESQMKRFMETEDAAGRYRAATGGKHLLGALIWAKGQRTPGNKFLDAKGIAKHLDDFCGSKRWEKALNLEDTAGMGVLVQGDVLEDFFAVLRAESVVFSLNPVRRMMVNDQGTLLGQETDPSITWVGEINTNQEVVSEGTAGNRQYSAKKAMLATPVGNDLLGSTLGARVAEIVEESIRFAYQIGFDEVLITGVGTQFRPTGLRNQALAAGNVASGGQALNNIFNDFRDAFNYVEQLNVPTRRLGMIMSPRSKNHIWLGNHGTDIDRWALRTEVATGTLFGVPLRDTTTVKNNFGGGTNESYIVFAEFSQVVVMEGPEVAIARSREASWTENAVDRHPRQEDVTVFWSLAKIDMVVPHREAVYIIDTVLYGT